eukprot:11187180-Lingulodinium_polyedra.AAC.1
MVAVVVRGGVAVTVAKMGIAQHNTAQAQSQTQARALARHETRYDEEVRSGQIRPDNEGHVKT